MLVWQLQGIKKVAVSVIPPNAFDKVNIAFEHAKTNLDIKRLKSDAVSSACDGSYSSEYSCRHNDTSKFIGLPGSGVMSRCLLEARPLSLSWRWPCTYVVRTFRSGSRASIAPIYSTKHRCLPKKMVSSETPESENGVANIQRGLPGDKIMSEMMKIAYRMKKDQWNKKISDTQNEPQPVTIIQAQTKASYLASQLPRLEQAAHRNAWDLVCESKHLKDLKKRIRQRSIEVEVNNKMHSKGLKSEGSIVRFKKAKGSASEVKLNTDPADKDVLPSPYFFIQQTLNKEALKTTYALPPPTQSSKPIKPRSATLAIDEKSELDSSNASPCPKLTDSQKKINSITMKQIKLASSTGMLSEKRANVSSSSSLFKNNAPKTEEEQENFPCPSLKSLADFPDEKDSFNKVSLHLWPVEIATSSNVGKSAASSNVTAGYDSFLKYTDNRIRTKLSTKKLCKEIIIFKDEGKDKKKGDFLSNRNPTSKELLLKESTISKGKGPNDDVQKSNFSSLTQTSDRAASNSAQLCAPSNFKTVHASKESKLMTVPRNSERIKELCTALCQASKDLTITLSKNIHSSKCNLKKATLNHPSDQINNASEKKCFRKNEFIGNFVYAKEMPALDVKLNRNTEDNASQSFIFKDILPKVNSIPNKKLESVKKHTEKSGCIYTAQFNEDISKSVNNADIVASSHQLVETISRALSSSVNAQSSAPDSDAARLFPIGKMSLQSDISSTKEISDGHHSDKEMGMQGPPPTSKADMNCSNNLAAKIALKLKANHPSFEGQNQFETSSTYKTKDKDSGQSKSYKTFSAAAESNELNKQYIMPNKRLQNMIPILDSDRYHSEKTTNRSSQSLSAEAVETYTDSRGKIDVIHQPPSPTENKGGVNYSTENQQRATSRSEESANISPLNFRTSSVDCPTGNNTIRSTVKRNNNYLAYGKDFERDKKTTPPERVSDLSAKYTSPYNAVLPLEVRNTKVNFFMDTEFPTGIKKDLEIPYRHEHSSFHGTSASGNKEGRTIFTKEPSASFQQLSDSNKEDLSLVNNDFYKQKYNQPLKGYKKNIQSKFPSKTSDNPMPINHGTSEFASDVGRNYIQRTESDKISNDSEELSNFNFYRNNRVKNAGGNSFDISNSIESRNVNERRALNVSRKPAIKELSHENSRNNCNSINEKSQKSLIISADESINTSLRNHRPIQGQAGDEAKNLKYYEPYETVFNENELQKQFDNNLKSVHDDNLEQMSAGNPLEPQFVSDASRFSTKKHNLRDRLDAKIDLVNDVSFQTSTSGERNIDLDVRIYRGKYLVENEKLINVNDQFRPGVYGQYSPGFGQAFKDPSSFTKTSTRENRMKMINNMLNNVPALPCASIRQSEVVTHDDILEQNDLRGGEPLTKIERKSSTRRDINDNHLKSTEKDIFTPKKILNGDDHNLEEAPLNTRSRSPFSPNLKRKLVEKCLSSSLGGNNESNQKSKSFESLGLEDIISQGGYNNLEKAPLNTRSRSPFSPDLKRKLVEKCLSSSLGGNNESNQKSKSFESLGLEDIISQGGYNNLEKAPLNTRSRSPFSPDLKRKLVEKCLSSSLGGNNESNQKSKSFESLGLVDIISQGGYNNLEKAPLNTRSRSPFSPDSKRKLVEKCLSSSLDGNNESYQKSKSFESVGLEDTISQNNVFLVKDAIDPSQILASLRQVRQENERSSSKKTDPLLSTPFASTNKLIEEDAVNKLTNKSTPQVVRSEKKELGEKTKTDRFHEPSVLSDQEKKKSPLTFEYMMAEESRRSYETLRNLVVDMFVAKQNELKSDKVPQNMDITNALKESENKLLAKIDAALSANLDAINKKIKEPTISFSDVITDSNDRKSLKNSFYHLDKAKVYLENYLQKVGFESSDIKALEEFGILNQTPKILDKEVLSHQVKDKLASKPNFDDLESQSNALGKSKEFNLSFSPEKENIPGNVQRGSSDEMKLSQQVTPVSKTIAPGANTTTPVVSSSFIQTTPVTMKTEETVIRDTTESSQKLTNISASHTKVDPNLETPSFGRTLVQESTITPVRSLVPPKDEPRVNLTHKGVAYTDFYDKPNSSGAIDSMPPFMLDYTIRTEPTSPTLELTSVPQRRDITANALKLADISSNQKQQQMEATSRERGTPNLEIATSDKPLTYKLPSRAVSPSRFLTELQDEPSVNTNHQSVKYNELFTKQDFSGAIDSMPPFMQGDTFSTEQLSSASQRRDTTDNALKLADISSTQKKQPMQDTSHTRATPNLEIATSHKPLTYGLPSLSVSPGRFLTELQDEPSVKTNHQSVKYDELITKQDFSGAIDSMPPFMIGDTFTTEQLSSASQRRDTTENALKLADLSSTQKKQQMLDTSHTRATPNLEIATSDKPLTYKLPSRAVSPSRFLTELQDEPIVNTNHQSVNYDELFTKQVFSGAIDSMPPFMIGDTFTTEQLSSASQRRDTTDNALKLADISSTQMKQQMLNTSHTRATPNLEIATSDKPLTYGLPSLSVSPGRFLTELQDEPSVKTNHQSVKYDELFTKQDFSGAIDSMPPFMIDDTFTTEQLSSASQRRDTTDNALKLADLSSTQKKQQMLDTSHTRATPNLEIATSDKPLTYKLPSRAVSPSRFLIGLQDEPSINTNHQSVKYNGLFTKQDISGSIDSMPPLMLGDTFRAGQLSSASQRRDTTDNVLKFADISSSQKKQQMQDASHTRVTPNLEIATSDKPLTYRLPSRAVSPSRSLIGLQDEPSVNINHQSVKNDELFTKQDSSGGIDSRPPFMLDTFRTEQLSSASQRPDARTSALMLTDFLSNQKKQQMMDTSHIRASPTLEVAISGQTIAYGLPSESLSPSRFSTRPEHDSSVNLNSQATENAEIFFKQDSSGAIDTMPPNIFSDTFGPGQLKLAPLISLPDSPPVSLISKDDNLQTSYSHLMSPEIISNSEGNKTNAVNSMGDKINVVLAHQYPSKGTSAYENSTYSASVVEHFRTVGVPDPPPAEITYEGSRAGTLTSLLESPKSHDDSGTGTMTLPLEITKSKEDSKTGIMTSPLEIPKSSDSRIETIKSPPKISKSFDGSITGNKTSLLEIPKSLTGYWQKIWKNNDEKFLADHPAYPPLSDRKDLSNPNIEPELKDIKPLSPFDKFKNPLSPFMDKVGGSSVLNMLVENPMKTLSKAAFARRVNSNAQDSGLCSPCMKISQLSSNLQIGMPFLRNQKMNYNYTYDDTNKNGQYDGSENVAREIYDKAKSREYQGQKQGDEIILRHGERAKKNRSNKKTSAKNKSIKTIKKSTPSTQTSSASKFKRTNRSNQILSAVKNSVKTSLTRVLISSKQPDGLKKKPNSTKKIENIQAAKTINESETIEKFDRTGLSVFVEKPVVTSVLLKAKKASKYKRLSDDSSFKKSSALAKSTAANSSSKKVKKNPYRSFSDHYH